MVCITWQSPGFAPQIIHANDPAAYTLVKGWLTGNDMLVLHNAAYDMAVICAKWPDLIPLVFEKYERDQITDTMLRQQLLDIGNGVYRGYANQHGVWKTFRYNLDSLSRRLLRRSLQKDVWRLRYMEFIDVPLERWPEGARQYPLEDARSTLDCYLRQPTRVDDEFRQARYAFALYLSSAWGIRTHAAMVEDLAKEVRKTMRSMERQLMDGGLLKPSGKRNIKAVRARVQAVCTAKGLEPRFTEDKKTKKRKNIATDEDALLATEDDLLALFAEYSVQGAVLAKDIPMLRGGSVSPVHTRYTLADTGRSRSGGPNLQNLRVLSGIRECLIPRPGMVFIQADYEGLELRTLAQSCLTLLGRSRLADVLNSGKDPHLQLAAIILNITYEEAEKNKKRPDVYMARQTAKVANFGIPGGLGAAKLVKAARAQYGVLLAVDYEEAKRTGYPCVLDLKENYFKAFPEMREYFRHIETCKQNDGTYRIRQLFSKRIRGGCSYTAASNGYFQSLGSDVAKLAGWLIARACYTDPSSPLFGWRMVLFIHDEWILEGPEHQAHEAAHELERIMVKAAMHLLKGVKSAAPPMVMRYLSKEAREVLEDGRLVPWQANWCVRKCGDPVNRYYTREEAEKRMKELREAKDYGGEMLDVVPFSHAVTMVPSSL